MSYRRIIPGGPLILETNAYKQMIPGAVLVLQTVSGAAPATTFIQGIMRHHFIPNFIGANHG